MLASAQQLVTAIGTITALNAVHLVFLNTVGSGLTAPNLPGTVFRMAHGAIGVKTSLDPTPYDLHSSPRLVLSGEHAFYEHIFYIKVDEVVSAYDVSRFYLRSDGKLFEDVESRRPIGTAADPAFASEIVAGVIYGLKGPKPYAPVIPD